jgi:uncharacterized protein with FMN-binding domain
VVRATAALVSVTGSAVALAAGCLLAAAGTTSSTAPIPLPPAAPAGSTAEGLRVIQGPAVPTKYGPVQVAIGVQGRRLVRVWVLKLTNRYGRSVRASTAAAPVLERQSLRAGSARIHGVSGATYTSDGYRASLQAALDRIDG